MPPIQSSLGTLWTAVVVPLLLVAATVACVGLMLRLLSSREGYRMEEEDEEEDDNEDEDEDEEGGGRSGRTILVLDLDETLVHSPHPSTRGDVGQGLMLRPHVIPFLREVRRRFDEVVVFTAGVRDYASPILDLLDAAVGSPPVFSRRFYRDACSTDPRTGLLAKDLLRVVARSPTDRVWLLDNTPSTYALQPHLGVPIASFYGDPADRALLDDALPALLRRLAASASHPSKKATRGATP